MILKRILINDFGGLHNKSIELSPGMNVVYEADEAEKNTVFIFVKNMFFGMPEEGRGKNGLQAEGSDVAPLEEHGGTIWFQAAGKNYRLTRKSGIETEECELFCEDDQKLLNMEEEPMKKLLGGISETIFDNVMLVEPLGGISPTEKAKEIQSKLMILSKSADQLVDLGRSEQMLKMWRKGYLTQKERSQKTVQKEKEILAGKLEILENELDSLRGQKGQVAKEPAVIETQLQAIEKKNLGMVIAGLLAIIVGIVGIIGRFQLIDEMSKIGMDVCVLAAIATVIYTLSARRKLRTEFIKQKKKKVHLQSQQEKLKSSREDINGSYEEKLTAFTNLQSEYQEYEAETALPTSEDMETQALTLALDTIEMLSRDIYLKKGRKIRIRASRIFRELTNGKYMEFYGDEGQSIELVTETGTIKAENLDSGELELLYFSIGMAASELFAVEEVLPVVLDDIFSGTNKELLGRVERWLKKQSRQVVLITAN